MPFPTNLDRSRLKQKMFNVFVLQLTHAVCVSKERSIET